MVVQLAPKTEAIAQYLEQEEQADERSEYIQGKIIPMAGGTTNHNLVTGNLYLLLRLALKGSNNRVFIENVRLFIDRSDVFTYPDVMVILGEPIYYNETKTTVTNPSIIIEVLSPSTRDYDLGHKFEYYRSLDTLEEYILVDPEKILIMAYHRDNHKTWSLNILDNIDEILALKSAAIAMSLSEIYEGISFA